MLIVRRAGSSPFPASSHQHAGMTTNTSPRVPRFPICIPNDTCQISPHPRAGGQSATQTPAEAWLFLGTSTRPICRRNIKAASSANGNLSWRRRRHIVALFLAAAIALSSTVTAKTDRQLGGRTFVYSREAGCLIRMTKRAKERPSECPADSSRTAKNLSSYSGRISFLVPINGKPQPDI